jgi:hypothetical protein
MIDKATRAKLYKEAFALLDRAEALILAAHARMEAKAHKLQQGLKLKQAA